MFPWGFRWHFRMSWLGQWLLNVAHKPNTPKRVHDLIERIVYGEVR